MNTKHLFRWAGLAALAAGLCFVIVELLRPPVVMASVTTSRWVIVHSLALATSVFGLAGVTGLYARQAAAKEMHKWLNRGFARLRHRADLLPGFIHEAGLTVKQLWLT